MLETRERTFFLRADSPAEATAWLTQLQVYTHVSHVALVFATPIHDPRGHTLTLTC